MSRITQTDGIYRWSYTLSREQALVHYKNMLMVCGLVGGGISLIMMIALRRYEGA